MSSSIHSSSFDMSEQKDVNSMSELEKRLVVLENKLISSERRINLLEASAKIQRKVKK